MLPQSRKTRALLTYLATTGRAHRRDHLCSLLWDVPYDPRGALRTSLSKLRAVVDDASHRRVVAERDAVRFESADVEVDIVAIRRALAPDPGSVSTETLEWAAAAFRGEFAEGLNLSSCPEFQAWCVAEREDARRLHVHVLKTLVERFAAAPDLALPHARALVRVDSHAFAAHAMLLRLLIASGRRREAEDQFDLSIKVLAEAGAQCGAGTWPDVALARGRIGRRGSLSQRPLAHGDRKDEHNATRAGQRRGNAGRRCGGVDRSPHDAGRTSPG
jgi:DNA-binding SARP family transcriptional activator